MKKKIIKLILGSGTCLTIIAIVLIICILMIYNFFGGEITSSGLVEGNIEYSEDYLKALNKYVKNNEGYVSLSRIIYFYNEDDDLKFNDIYKENLDTELKMVKPISDVCIEEYSIYDVCDDENIESSNQVDEYSYKPFKSPVNFKDITITSFFGEERIIYDNYDIHYAWDFAGAAKTPVFSIGDGIVKKVRFNQNENKINKENGLGNYIEIEYKIENDIFRSIYGHLYPNSTNLKEGQIVKTGEKIAEIGTTGYSTGNHLDWQLYQNNKVIDGMDLIDFNL